MTTIEVIMNLMKSDPSENEIDDVSMEPSKLEWVSSHIIIGFSSLFTCFVLSWIDPRKLQIR